MYYRGMITKIFMPLKILLLVSLGSFEVHSNNVDESQLLIHKTPTCGCCKKWIKHLEEDGFLTLSEDHKSLQEIKEKYNIKPKYRSCHTGVSKEGYIFEGHIPSKYISQFLSEKNPNAIGLSVPGMPLGSPGMEIEGMFTPYNVLILFKDGSSKVYAEVRE
tara:strand:- start:2476 stop:2958 length:483 start_codon:yes stop_codon:yes gene_type:complete